ncbi:T9SS type A sorting domain-containing protein [Hymenobacter lutimineralis]|uniref:T9SS type A sorting domain-containing protein n=1 Tax=Hymenobacter lutimineralis TaxID=2606448 RepID=A0A5D6V7U4_9BACT|nr:T9SS type A sorting domain-containing protein [Hymenobacter lutimineralis]
MSLLLNDGMGNFVFNAAVSVVTSHLSVALGDADGDGDLDFVTVNNGNSTVSMRLNQPAPVVPVISAVSPAAELPGMPVVLTGTNFAAGSTVSFGGVPAASVTFTSATSLTAVVPSGVPAGAANVTVTTAGTTSSPRAFTALQVYNETAACLASASYLTTGDGQWHYLLSTGGDVLAALQDTRAGLGTVTVSLQATGPAGPVRQDGRGNKYLDRNFRLTATTPAFPGSSVNVRFYGLTAEFDRLQTADAGLSYASRKATQYNGPNEDCELGNNSPTGEYRVLALAASTPGGGVPWFVAQAAVADHFSEFYLTGSSTPLPVELVAFTAQAQGPAVALAWRTASEKNSAHFELERSPDGTAFAHIGTVAAQGTTSHPTGYAYLDAAPPFTQSATLYYRLKQVDQDGTSSYSPVRLANLPPFLTSSLTIFPNPTAGAAVLKGAAPGAMVTVFNPLGRLVLTATADAAGTAHLTLPAGMYVVRSGGQARRLAVE